MTSMLDINIERVNITFERYDGSAEISFESKEVTLLHGLRQSRFPSSRPIFRDSANFFLIDCYTRLTSLCRKKKINEMFRMFVPFVPPGRFTSPFSIFSYF